MAKLLVFLGQVFFASTLYGASFYIEPSQSDVLKNPKVVDRLIQSSIAKMRSHNITKKRSKADYILKSETMKLGKSYLFTLSKHKGDKLVYSHDEKSKSIEDLDVVVRKVTKTVIKGGPLRGDQDVSDVTEEEEESLDNKRRSHSATYLGFGPSYSSNLDAEGVMLNISLGAYFEVNHRVSLKLFYDGHFSMEKDNEADVHNIGIGANYFFSTKSYAPFVTLDFGLALTDRHLRASTGFFDDDAEEDQDGFMIGGGVGFTLFRVSDVNLEFQLRVSRLLEKNSEGAPSLAMGRIGVVF